MRFPTAIAYPFINAARCQDRLAASGLFAPLVTGFDDEKMSSVTL
jgi:hypothetical protein